VAGGHTLTQTFSQALWWTTEFAMLAVLASFFLPARPGGRAPLARPAGSQVGEDSEDTAVTVLGLSEI